MKPALVTLASLALGWVLWLGGQWLQAVLELEMLGLALPGALILLALGLAGRWLDDGAG